MDRDGAVRALALLGGASAGLLALTAGQAGAHNINQDWRIVADNGTTCVQARAEIDHDEGPDRNRMVWIVRSQTENSVGSPCANARTRQMRLKGYRYHREHAAAPWAICTGTVGDGLGDPGYIHHNTTSIDIDSPWTTGGPCGGGQYLSQTWGHVQNNGWFGGHTNSGIHDFK